MTTVRILRLAIGGDGVGRLDDGRAVFVPRTAPGDLVELTDLRLQKRFARARPGRVLEPSAERVEANALTWSGLATDAPTLVSPNAWSLPS